MNSNIRCVGQLKALLSCIEPTSDKQYDADVVLSFSHTMEQILTQYSDISTQMINQAKKDKTDLQRTSTSYNHLKSIVDGLRTENSELLKQGTELKKCKGSLEKNEKDLKNAQRELESFKAEYKELKEELKKKDQRIDEMTSLYNDKVERINQSNKLKDENISILEGELKIERDNITKLQIEIDNLRVNHEKEIQELKLEMGEKVLKAQARINRQADHKVVAPLDDCPINYAEIYKKKMTHMEATYQKEITELRRTINQLKQ